MRPATLYLAAIFGVMLVGFPVIMQVAGVDTAGVVGTVLLIAVAALICYAIIRAMAAGYEDDREHLLAGETLATWRLSHDDHRRFLAGERRRTRRLAVSLVLVGAAIGVGLGIAEDWLLGGIMIGSFVFAAVVALILGGPPRSASGEAEREMLIGTRGVQVLDRYVPFHGPLTRLQRVELQLGDPTVLIFHVGTRSRITDVRVPVPRDRVVEAEALVDRLG